MTGGLAGVWVRFRGMMFGRLEALEAVVALLGAGTLPEAERRRGEHEAHKLAGSLGTFGLPEGSRAAREIERLLEGSRPLAAEEAGRVERLTAELRRLMEAFGGPA